ncbi:superfamily II DNA/RNA helicase [Arcanobacterium wilhelmae]|uniref:RNA helicase n=1 Tax=Arcanobacterium wilhelmae TaxID=1803177 RepID=A0ABT9NCN4_9ACTO|nr:DEAD/DEAH box helicase [Arcanobacterium wilhelmae]MDP9801485.1 superfamily II DNA/RNA helicase [Arcanobacterium wilhelmae]WFN90816.1 DEAD/DEAH box helicase [Arcanobacterium wilhelmae]
MTESGIVDTSNAQVPQHNEPAADITGGAEELNLEAKTFADFGVAEPIARALSEKGITHPFPIQALTLPVALGRRDIIGQAKTGTGKTLGFGLPMLMNAIGPGEEGWDSLPHQGLPQGLVVLPTRELAKQVAGDLRDAAKYRSLRVVEVYGGRAYEPQVEDLTRGTEIVVGTPGRLIDLMKHKSLRLDAVNTVVLDEADEMLDLGFLEDVETILAATPANRHTMLFSATMPGAVVHMARRYMSHPTHIRAQDPHDETTTVQSVKQVIYRAHALNKIEVVARILQARGRELAIIFTRTKRTAARVADELTERGFAAGALHGDLGQGAREQALRAFRNGKIDVLVATDVAARGIDVDNVTHVINYQCPEDEKTYLHRIGRTGRAGHSGTAVTFVDWDDVPRWAVINNQLGLGFPEPVETYHTSEHLYTDLDIPTEVTGRLPKAKRTRAGLDAEEIEDLGETGAKGGRGGRSRRRGGSKRSGNGKRPGDEKRSGEGREKHAERKDSAKRTDSTAEGSDKPKRRRRRRRVNTAQ